MRQRKTSFNIEKVPLRSVFVMSRIKRKAVVDTLDHTILSMTEEKFQLALKLPGAYDLALWAVASFKRAAEAVVNALAQSMIPTPQMA